MHFIPLTAVYLDDIVDNGAAAMIIKHKIILKLLLDR